MNKAVLAGKPVESKESISNGKETGKRFASRSTGPSASVQVAWNSSMKRHGSEANP